MNHTPGPWEIIITKNPEIISHYEMKIGERKISFFPYIRHSETIDGIIYGGYVIDKQHLADINLIAAAPDLLEACKFVMNKCSIYGPADRARDKVEKTIEKAEGK